MLNIFDYAIFEANRMLWSDSSSDRISKLCISFGCFASSQICRFTFDQTHHRF